MSNFLGNDTYGKKFYYAAVCPTCHEVFWAQTIFPEFDCKCGTKIANCKRVDERELEMIKKTGNMAS